MFLSVVILGGFTTRDSRDGASHSAPTRRYLDHIKETHPYQHCSNVTRATLSGERMCGHVVSARTHRKDRANARHTQAFPASMRLRTLPGFIAAPLVLLGLLSVAPASAAPPAHSLPDPIVLPGSGPGVDGYCDGFTVVVTFTKYKQQVVQDTTVGDFQTLKFTWNAQATVTREDDPKKSVNYNVSGPGTIVTNLVDGSFSADAHGPNPLDYEGQLVPGRPADQLHHRSRNLCGRPPAP